MSTSPETQRLVPFVSVVEAARVLESRAPGSGVTVCDLRSPEEFAEDHIPGAHNVPLFDDAQRALVGTLYARRSRDEAFDAGCEIAAERIRPLVARVLELAGRPSLDGDLAGRLREMTAEGIDRLEKDLEEERCETLPPGALVLHCWRGGLRSRSVVSFLRAFGVADVFGVVGGYKAYRRNVIERLASYDAPPAYCLRGLTGVGKTLVLREIERMRPGWTFDLELAAGHRSSLLGMVGLEPCSQKMFETRLAERIRAGFPGVVIYEGESRKVGDAIIPNRVWTSLRGATNVELTAGEERRVQVLMEDYLASADNRPALRTQLAAVEGRMQPRFELVQLFDSGREEELVRLLLEHYYDPLYRHSERGKDYALSVDTTDPARAAEQIIELITTETGCTSR